MDYNELIKAIDKAKKVSVYCSYGQGTFRHEGEYFEVSKKNAIKTFKKDAWFLKDNSEMNVINVRIINNKLLIG